MRAALFAVIVIGAVGGSFLPRAEPAERVVAGDQPVIDAPTVAAPRVKPTQVRPAGTATAGSWGGETRLRARTNGHFYATALVNGQPIEFVVDTGATTVALTVEDARRAGIHVDPARFETVGMGAGGPLRGQPVTIPLLSMQGEEARSLQAVVLEGADVSLLGQSFLSRLEEVRIAGGEMILR